MKNIFTVDVEDWYQGFPPRVRLNGSPEKRLAYGMHRLLDLLDAQHVRATFFWLGECARDHPSLLQETARRGHEIGCHGYSHTSLFTHTPATFRLELARALETITSLTGKAVQCFRAPYFSIVKETWWALEILREHGILYDASIMPMVHWRTGIPGYNDRIGIVSTSAGNIIEAPVTVIRRFGKLLPTSGGGYFRLYSYDLTQKHIRHKNQLGQPAMFYIHPWELDPDQPPVTFSPTHYLGLTTTAQKLSALLTEQSFGPLMHICDQQLSSR